MITIIIIGLTGNLIAVEMSSEALAGCMFQPSSQYCHYTGGLGLKLENKKSKNFFELQYFERPQFSESGYKDGESFFLVNFGKTIYSHKEFNISTSWGGGSHYSYIVKEASNIRRSVLMYGMSLSISASYQVKKIAVSAKHIQFIVRDSQEQLSAYVVWPFNFTVFGVSYLF